MLLATPGSCMGSFDELDAGRVLQPRQVPSC